MSSYDNDQSADIVYEVEVTRDNDQSTDIVYEVEVARDSDLYHEETEFSKVRCRKNPGHEDGFIPIDKLDINDLPNDYRTDQTFNNIVSFSKRVVKLTLPDSKSTQNEKMRGSGWVERLNNEYYIITNNHVVKNNIDAKNCTIEFNYDSNDKSRIVTCEGIQVDNTCAFKDKTQMSFKPVPDFIKDMNIHDKGMYYPSIEIAKNNKETMTCKVLTIPVVNQVVGIITDQDLNNEDIKHIKLNFINGSSSEVGNMLMEFYPVPDNIKSPDYKHPVVEIAVDGTDSRKVQGEINFTTSKVLLRLPEPVTKQESTNCWIYFPDGSQSVGSGFYFVSLSPDIFLPLMKGAVSDILTPSAASLLWFVAITPSPWTSSTGYEMKINPDTIETNSMVVIDHPHGGPKMVTFGRDLGRSIIRTEGGEVNCMTYSCKTCNGSSGSPVIRLIYMNSDMLSYFLFEPHFKGRSEKVKDGDKIEYRNINMAHTRTLLL